MMTDGTMNYFGRAHISTGAHKILARGNDCGNLNYVIRKNKIYYRYGNGKKKVMKLNGKSKKNTSVIPKNKSFRSNTKGYSIIMTEKYIEDECGIIDDETGICENTLITTYLKTPAGKFKLGSHIAY